jgi:hypothetical protein
MIDIPTILKNIEWHKEQPAKPTSIQKLVNEAIEDLPEEYLSLLLYSDGGEGKLGIEPGWFQLWPTADVINLNRSYEVDKNVPDFFGFGGDGGGELLAFDIKHGKPWRIVMIPFIPMTADQAIIIANNFVEFIQAIGRDIK